MIRRPINPMWRNFMCLLSVVVFVGGYTYLSVRQHHKNPKDTTIPMWFPGTFVDEHTGEEVSVKNQFAEGWAKITESKYGEEPWLYRDLKATVSRHVGGLFIGSLAAIFIGISMGVNRYAEWFFKFPVFIFSKIPPTAMMAVYFVLFGTEYKMFAAMIALGIFPVLCQAIYESAVNDVEEDTIFKTYTLGGSHGEVIETIFYITLPRIIENIRLQVGPALVFLIAAELLVGADGFGYTLRIQSRLLNMNVVYIYLIILGVSFTLMDIFFQIARRVICPWYGRK